MDKETHDRLNPMSAENRGHFYQKHLKAAILQGVASVFMWLFALAAYLMRLIESRQFIGVSFAVLYLVLINVPTLRLLRRIKYHQRLLFLSTLINFSEILGYTAVIYFLGGIEATYLVCIYAAMIAYVGTVSSRNRTYLVTGMCILAYSTMVLLEGSGFIPWFKVIHEFHLPWPHRLARMLVVNGLLMIVAYFTSYSANLLRKTRDKLRRAQRNLEKQVAERTAELIRSNSELRQEVQERKAAEESLTKSHETFFTVLDSIDATIYVADMQTHKILFMNRNMKEAFGSDGTGAHCWQIFQRETAPCSHCSMGRLLDEAGNPAGVFVWENENPVTGRWYINYDRAIKWVDGRWVFIQIAFDISKLKELEKERIEAEKKLNRAQRMEALGVLAGGVAHDLNNVLSGIVSYPELLLMQIDEDSPLRDPIVTIQKTGEKAAEIVQDLLTLARRGVATTEVLNLNDIVVEYIHSPEHHKLVSFHPDVDVRLDLEEDLWNLKGSPIHLRKSLMNLVTNAAEAQPSGGMIIISTANLSMTDLCEEIAAKIKGDAICLKVADKGSGIKPQDLNRIFEPFYTRKKMGRSGTGLGMAVVWGSMEDHQGHIRITSKKNAGTTFELYLPATRESVIQTKGNISIEEYLGQQQKILVVDDLAEQREIATKVLTQLNYQVITSDSGEAAVEYLRKHVVDLVVLDMIMEPGMDGLETYKLIKAIRPNQKAIIASGFSESRRVKEAQKLGAGNYVKKPYSIESIGIAVKDGLAGAAGV